MVVRIDNTHPYNFGDPPKKEYIKGAASACWKASRKRLKYCEYLLAVYEDKIVDAFKIENKFYHDEVLENKIELQNHIKYPSFRKYEIEAHACKTPEEIKEKLGEHISIFKKVVKVDIDNPKEFSNWKKRCFLILKDCDNENLNSLAGESLPYKTISNKFRSHTYYNLEV